MSLGYNDATIRSTVTAEDANGNPIIVSGIRTGARLPSVPTFQAGVQTTYQHKLTDQLTGYITGTFQHIGSRYTQVGDDVPGFGIVPLQNNPNALPNTIGGPLTQDNFVFDPLLPAYDILNFRIGTRFDMFDISLFVEQRDGRAGLPGARPGARPPGPRGLPDQPAEEFRDHGPDDILSGPRRGPTDEGGEVAGASSP